MPRPVRVTHVLEAAQGGAMRHLRELASLADRSVLEISFVLSPLRDPEGVRREADRLRSEGFEVRLVPMRRSPSLSDLSALFSLAAVLRELRPDVVHLHAAKAGALGRLAAALAGVPHVVYTPHLWSFAWEDRPLRRLLYRSVERALAPLADAVVVLTSGQAREALDARVLPASLMTVVPNAVPLPPESSRPPSPPPFVLGAAGRLVPQKGMDVLLRALAELAESGLPVRLRIAGDGPLRGELERLSASLALGEAVEFCGHVEDMSGFFSSLHLFVLPSRWEGMPYVLLDALAAGLPAAASDIAGARPLVLDGWNGRLFPRDDHRALASVLGELLASPAALARMGSNSRRMAERFPPDDFACSHEQIYLSLAERRPVFHA